VFVQIKIRFGIFSFGFKIWNSEKTLRIQKDLANLNKILILNIICVNGDKFITFIKFIDLCIDVSILIFIYLLIFIHIYLFVLIY